MQGFASSPPLCQQTGVLPHLYFWIDPVPRDGPGNMAVDEWLVETCREPFLRSYRWAPGWGSFGYFVRMADLPEGDLKWVRRWTGGGIVDHRQDWTYTLFVPRGHALAEARGAESYRVIHGAVAAALRAGGHPADLAGPSAPAAGGDCFARPVEHDLLDAAGRKIAGAGQRRTARGLLHQGSVSLALPRENALAEALSGQVEMVDLSPDPAWLASRIASRYGTKAWTGRR